MGVKVDKCYWEVIDGVKNGGIFLKILILIICDKSLSLRRNGRL